jgi:hypothetical protein
MTNFLVTCPASCNIASNNSHVIQTSQNPYGERFITLHPTPKLEDHPLSVVHDCLNIVFTVFLIIYRLSTPSASRGQAVTWWQGNHLTWVIVTNQLTKKLILTQSRNSSPFMEPESSLPCSWEHFFFPELCVTFFSKLFFFTVRSC